MKRLAAYEDERRTAFVEMLTYTTWMQKIRDWEADAEKLLEGKIQKSFDALKAVNKVHRAAYALDRDGFLTHEGVLVAHKAANHGAPRCPVIYYHDGSMDHNEMCPDCANKQGNDSEVYGREVIVFRGEVYYENQAYFCPFCNRELVAEVLP